MDSDHSKGIGVDYEHSKDPPSKENSWIDSNHKIASDGTVDGNYNGSVPQLNIDEPYIGQEFESEEAAFEFFSAYAMRMGFVTRINQTHHCDGSVVSRTLVCSRAGFQRPKNKNEMICKSSREPRTSIRVGCKARVSFKKRPTGKWFIRSFIKEHSHALNDSLSHRARVHKFHQVDDKRINDLTRELIMERRRSASLREFIDLLFQHIEEHTQGLSEKIQYIVEKVNKIESEVKCNKKCEIAVTL
ncbi:hypothetical protein JCGZ_18068 [Jatropha curcas]|uniref:FAR1 domain-containing protein n=2 Tax=Jatropha curcas TaxID=180498 RepID=A0A067K3S3_JATCU|nr:hypothetical protein JCGZ_18068 [Jatropha curcas]